MNSLLRPQGLQIISKVLHPPTYAPYNLSNPECFQCVRWATKPRWLPIAKTKMFRVPERKRFPPDELAYYRMILCSYKTALKGIANYYSEKLKSQTTAPEVIAEQARKEQEDNAMRIKMNEEWNREVAKIREERTAREAELRKEEVLSNIDKLTLAEEEEIRRIDVLVKEEKEKSATFITAANIDEAIEKALSETVDFNYCIDLEGNMYKGLRARPGVTEPAPLAETAASN